MSRLSAIAANLEAWRLGVRPARGPLLNEVYGSIFKADFYRTIWDEPVLLGLERFIEEHPPDQKVYAEELEFIRERTAIATSINGLFAACLFRAPDELPRMATQPHVSEALAVLQANGALPGIRDSSFQPIEKLELLVTQLAERLPSMSESFKGCLGAVRERQGLGAANCLVVARQHRIGMLLRLHTRLEPGPGVVRISVPAAAVFQSAVERACGALRSRGLLGTRQDVIFSAEITDAMYSGSSITLPAAMAIYSSAREWQFDPYTAFTGDVNIRDAQWRILGVEGIAEKLDAACYAGIRRVVLPKDNQADVPKRSEGPELLFVDDINEVLAELTLPRDPLAADTVQQKKVYLLNAYSLEQGWQVSAAREIQSGLQLTVSPASGGDLTVSIFGTGTHTPKDHENAGFKKLLRHLGELDSPSVLLQSVQRTFNLTVPGLRRQIRKRLEALSPSEAKTEQYCEYSFVYAIGKERLLVKQYSSGKLQLQGYAGPLYQRVLEVITQAYNLHYPNATLDAADYMLTSVPSNTSAHGGDCSDPAVPLPYIGTDESGKGDYFGPLVVAGVWVDEALQRVLSELRVRDSKEVTDRQCRELAGAIRRACPGKYHLVEISPDKYNELYSQFVREKRNLNYLLAWGHARAIEDLVSRQQCDNAIADQFGDEKYISSKLMEKGKALKLIQMPKAERFIAVAAASVLARDRFLSRLSHLSEEAGISLPKGASPAVIEAARQIVQKLGPNALGRFAKLHFKTTTDVLGKG